MIEESGIIKYYRESQEIENKDRYENILELLNSIDEFCLKNPESTLSDFLEEVSLLTDIDNWNDSENRVTLMTVHSSKGLEFPVVFVSGLDDGLFPLFRTFDNQSELEEERRLFYVAVTRARHKVFLLYATNRRRLGGENIIGLAKSFYSRNSE